MTFDSDFLNRLERELLGLAERDAAVDHRPLRAGTRRALGWHRVRRSRRPLVVVFATTLVILLVALFGSWGAGGDNLPVALQTAVAQSCNDPAQPLSPCLHAFAGVARAQSAHAHGLAYWEREIHYGLVGQHITPQNATQSGFPPGSITKPFFAYKKTKIETWIAPDQKVYATEHGIGVTFGSAADRAAWQASGSPNMTAWLRRPLGTSAYGHQPTATEWYLISDVLNASVTGQLSIAHLPSSADELLHALRRVAAHELPGTPGSAACAEQRPSCPPKTRGIVNRAVQEMMLSLLRYPLTPPSARGTLFEAFSRVRGARLLGTVTDPAGRAGIGILITHNPDENILVFQPKTAQLLATGLLANPTHNSIAKTRWWTAYRVATGVARRVPASVKTAPQYCCR